jgi:hypothetical protein
MSTLSGRLADAVDAVRSVKTMATPTQVAANYDELIDAADAMLDAAPIDKIRDALNDANGLPPTAAASDVLVAVIFALNRTDEKWGERGFPGAPSTTDYAAAVAAFLELRYPIKGAML